MIQRRERLGLLLEAPQPVCIAHERLRQHLDCQFAVQPRVPCAKYLTHPPRADTGGDSVLVERSADHFLSRNSSNQFSTRYSAGVIGPSFPVRSARSSMRKRSPLRVTTYSRLGTMS